MTWVAVAGAGASVLGGIIGGKKDKQTTKMLTTNLANRTLSGTGGFSAFAGDDGAGFDLGALSRAFMGQAGFAGDATDVGRGMLTGDAPGFGYSQALDAQDLNLGSLYGAEAGGNAMAMRSLSDAFGGGFDPSNIANRQLSLLRSQAAPQEASDRQNFISDLYSTGRGAVTGAAGNEASMGGGRLAAAFAQGQSRADIDRQIAAQETGINAANASEGLLKSAFGRFMDSSQFASEAGAGIYGRQQQALTGARGRAIENAGLPAQVAQLFQQLAQGGIGSSIDLQNLGLAGQTNALQTASASANARIGSGQNVAGFMSGRSQTPGLDAISNFFAGIAKPNQGGDLSTIFRGVFNRDRNRTVLGDGGVP